MAVVKRALISLSDKTGVVDFALKLKDLGVEILSTGGTAKMLADAGVSLLKWPITPAFPKCLMAALKRCTPRFTVVF